MANGLTPCARTPDPCVIGLITARGGSKSIPRKNVMLVGGKPLISWTIEAALQSQGISRVMVSTDDDEIAQVSEQWGAEVPFMRPPDLARDDSSHISVVLHALRWLESHDGGAPDYLMLLQPTSPLRTVEDIESAIHLARDREADSVVGVCETHQHPHLVKRIAPDGTLEDFANGSSRLGSSAARRQVLPPAYFVNGAIYLTQTRVLFDQQTFQPTRTLPYVMPQRRSLQIDDPWDLHLVRLILDRDGS
jgi:CMP-N-acetylneuraminic acid synthetase